MGAPESNNGAAVRIVARFRRNSGSYHLEEYIITVAAIRWCRGVAFR